jgi:hypothetical protein
MCLRFQFCTHQRVCILHFLKKSQIRCTLVRVRLRGLINGRESAPLLGISSSVPFWSESVPNSLEDHRFTTALIFPQQVEEANSRSWQNSGTLSIHTRKERIDQKPSHATIPLKYIQDHCCAAEAIFCCPTMNSHRLKS